MQQTDCYTICFEPPTQTWILRLHALPNYKYIGRASCLKTQQNFFFFHVGTQILLTKPKLFRGLHPVQTLRASPWCFPPIFQSCLLRRLCPLIGYLPRVLNLPSSCQRSLAAQCCLSGGASSLFGHPPLLAFCLLCLLVALALRRYYFTCNVQWPLQFSPMT